MPGIGVDARLPPAVIIWKNLHGEEGGEQVEDQRGGGWREEDFLKGYKTLPGKCIKLNMSVWLSLDSASQWMTSRTH